MTDWKHEIDETSDIKVGAASDVPPRWQPSSDTINTISNRNEVAEGQEWVNKGIQNVEVDRINLKESPVQDEGDFRKVSKAQMSDGFDKLESTVRPSVEKGADGDYFNELDQTKGLDYEHGYRRVYDAFYGSEPIRLEKIGDTYNVVNGYHRLSIAKETGITTVPAWVLEQRS